MTDSLQQSAFSRRVFVKGGGALVVGFSFAGAGVVGRAEGARAASSGSGGGFPLAQQPVLDNWLAVHPDGTVTFSIEKADVGTHMQTGLLQIAAEELDMPFERMRLQSGDTSITPDLGTSSSSAGITGGGPVVRAAAATARQTLVTMASAHLGVPASKLQTKDGVVSVVGDPSRSVSYAELIGGKRFNVTLRRMPAAQVIYSSPAAVYGTARPKDPRDYTIVGRSVAPLDIPAKVTGGDTYVTAVTLPGMVHARAVRPPTNGARLISVDKGSISHLPGIVDVVVKNDYVAVVAEDEWVAVQAAAELKTKWSDWKGGLEQGQPAVGDQYSALRTLPHINHANDVRGTVNDPVTKVGDVDKALAGAAKTLTATYESPFHLHGPIGPPAVVADVTADQATAWTASQNIFGMRGIIATLLGLPERNVRLISVAGASAFGDSNTDDCVTEACLLSQEIRRPVRLQLMRWDDHVWDSGHSARTSDLRGGLDKSGKLVAWDAQSWTANNGGRPYGDPDAVNGLHTAYEYPNPSKSSGSKSTSAGGGVHGTSLLPAVFMGLASEYDVEGMASASDLTPGYTIPNVRSVLHYLGKGSPRAEPLDGQPQATPAGSIRIRTSSMASVGGQSVAWAIESFIDELAAAASTDPIAFRAKHLDPVHGPFLETLAKHAGWQPRPSPGPGAKSSSVILSGRGMAGSFGTDYQSKSVPFDYAEVIDVEVNRKTGKVTIPRVAMVMTSGLIINPDLVRQQMEGNTMFGLSQALLEERVFTKTTITSRDWVSYPILRFVDSPPEIDVLVLQNIDQPSGSASETNDIPPAALGNAIFDATGVRIRTLPFTPKRVLAALEQAGRAIK